MSIEFSKKEKGELLEDMVSDIFRHWGFNVKARVKLRDKYDVSHEIDVLASKKEPFGTVKIAVECKYVKTPIGIKEVRNFREKLSALGITKGIFVSTTGLTSDANAYAKSVAIESWDLAIIQEKMREIQALEEKIHNAIQISNSIMDFAKPDHITNSALFQVIEKPEMNYKPYYLVDYECISQHRVGGSVVNLESKGIIAIDAVTPEAVDVTVDRGHRPHLPSGTVAECSSLNPISISSANLTGEFTLTVETPKITSVEAKKIAKKEIVRNLRTEYKYHVGRRGYKRVRTLRPFKKDIEILDSSLIYVPYVVFKLKVMDKEYQRTVQAATEKIVLDETYYCSTCENQANAVCERCGTIVCNKHWKHCVLCNKVICSSCVITRGVVFKKYYCPECMQK